MAWTSFLTLATHPALLWIYICQVVLYCYSVEAAFLGTFATAYTFYRVDLGIDALVYADGAQRTNLYTAAAGNTLPLVYHRYFLFSLYFAHHTPP